MMLKRLGIALLIVLLFASPVRAQTTAAGSIAQKLICQCGCDMVLATCDCEEADGAAEMKALIEQKLAQGQSAEQISQFFVDQYGEQVLASPPKRNSNPLPWSAALIGILVVGTVIYLTQKKRVRRK